VTAGTRARADRRDAEGRRAEILDAAATLFRTFGYGSTSVQVIADSVGLLKGSLYHHFASKEEILAELLIDVHRDALGMLDQVDSLEGTGLERVAAYVRGHATWTIRHIDRVEIFLQEFHHLDPSRALEIRRLRQRFADFLADSIAAAQDQGAAFAALDPRVAAHAILGMLNWVGHWYRKNDGLGDDDLIAQLTHQAVASLRP
jgi:TetR/AcrR family transcriptional regulator, cholesterol catabolism regulator